jgi:hypothetical protein
MTPMRAIMVGPLCSTTRSSAPTAALQLEQHVNASGRYDGQPDQRNSEEQCVAIHGAAPMLCSRSGTQFRLSFVAGFIALTWIKVGDPAQFKTGQCLGSDHRTGHFQPRSATMVDGLAEPLHGEFDVVRLEVAPALDFGEVTVLRKSLKVFRGELSGGDPQSGELFADVRVWGHAPLKRARTQESNRPIDWARSAVELTRVAVRRCHPGL